MASQLTNSFSVIPDLRTLQLNLSITFAAICYPN